MAQIAIMLMPRLHPLPPRRPCAASGLGKRRPNLELRLVVVGCVPGCCDQPRSAAFGIKGARRPLRPSWGTGWRRRNSLPSNGEPNLPSHRNLGTSHPCNQPSLKAHKRWQGAIGRLGGRTSASSRARRNSTTELSDAAPVKFQVLQTFDLVREGDLVTVRTPMGLSIAGVWNGKPSAFASLSRP